MSNAIPNPTEGNTRVNYTLPEGANTGEIVFCNQQGEEVKRFKVDRTFDHLLISTADLPAGSYFYQLQCGGTTIGGKKVIVVK